MGPTLEFYALVSAEMQRCDLNLWNESDTYRSPSSSIVDAVKTGIEDDPHQSHGGRGESNNHNQTMLIENSAETNTERGQFNLIDADDVNNTNTVATAVPMDRPFVHAPFGLFPSPLGHTSKLSQVTRIKNKFKFLGKFMAKAIMDSRMVSSS